MAWTRNESEELGHGEEKIDNLRNEEEQHRLAEMSNDSDHGKRHASEVAQRVTDENLRWTPEGNRRR